MEHVPLREFEPLSKLLRTIPNKVQKAFRTHPIEWTCIDVTKQYIAVGCDAGVVFLYDRNTEKLLRLECKNPHDTVTCISMCESVDYLVAVSTLSGSLCIFQLPSVLPGRNKQLQKYEVENLHHSKVTCLMWSQNAMKLFSGDEDGLVNCTELDYDKFTSKSYFVHKEAHEIVQFDYSSRILLISTRFRTLLVSFIDKSHVQVGTKDRKLLGHFGAVFLPGAYQQTEKVLFAARPGFRLWKASGTGTVNATYIFKDLLKHSSEGIALLDDTLRGNRSVSAQEDKQFGPLHMYQDTQLVTHNSSSLYVIDPGLGNFVGYHNNLGRILDIAVCNDEIFILRNDGPRKIIRIAQTSDLNARTPSPPMQTTSRTAVETASSARPIELMTHTAHTVVGAFKGMGDKLMTVQEGHKAKPPPWGVVRQGSVEEGKELSPSETPSPGAVTNSDHVADNVEVETIGGSSDCSASGYSQTSVGTIQVGFVSQSIQSTSSLISSKDGGSSAIANYTAPGGPAGVRPETIHHPGAPPIVDSDIVFPVKNKKKAKKKGKGRDKDTVSNSSLEVQTSKKSGDSCDNNGEQATLEVSSAQNNARATEDYKANTTDINEESNCDPKHSAVEPCVTEQQSTENVKDEVSTVESNVNGEQLLKTRLELESELTALPWQQDKSNNANCDVQLENVEDIRVEYDNGEVISEKLHSEQTSSKTGEQSLAENLQSAESESSQSKVDSRTSAAITPKVLKIRTNTDNIPVMGSQEESKSNKIKPDPKPENITPAVDTPIAINTFSGTSSDETEDFYSMYASPTSPIYSPVGVKVGGTAGWKVSSIVENEPSIEDAVESSATDGEGNFEKAVQLNKEVSFSQEVEPDMEVGTMSETGTWNEFSVPGNLQFVCVTHRHVWIVDKSERLYYSFLEGPGLRWHRVEVPAQQISVSPSGMLVWRMHRGMLYAGTKITTRAPAGLKWEDFVQSGVAHISVDETMGWYVKTSGELVMHKNLTRERPCYVPLKVPCDQALLKVECSNGIVWALTDDRNLIVRMGVKKGKEEGDSWHYLGSGGPSQLVADFSLGEEDTVWVIDVVGRLWFMTGVKPSKPQGEGQWWQVSMTEYLMQDATALGILKSISDYPNKLLQYVQQSDGGGLVSARCNGIWACPGHKNILHVCKTGLLGHRWETLSLPGVAPAITWKHICAAGLSNNDGYIWTQQPNGGIFCFNPQRSARTLKVMEVTPPEPEVGVPALCMSVALDVVWVLMPTGKVYVRAGIHSSCPHGIKWLDLDLTQLGSKVHFVWLCCGGQNVWAVENKGRIYLRIGVHAPSNQLLNPAWVPVEGAPQTLGAKFVKVFTGPNDWMVWAIDSMGYVYVRKGVTDAMPIGSHWVYVPGSTATDLVVSENSVYAVTSTGEILIRCDVTEDNVMGNCWSKIPGVLTSLSAAREGDGLWGINKEGHLCRRFTHFLNKKLVLSKLQSVVKSEEGDWEMI